MSIEAQSKEEQNRWEIAPGIFVGEDYYWKRSGGWQWNGVERWWEYYVEITGMNGAGGVWCIEKSRWNGALDWQFRQPQLLSYVDSCELIQALIANLASKAAA